MATGVGVRHRAPATSLPHDRFWRQSRTAFRPQAAPIGRPARRAKGDVSWAGLGWTQVQMVDAGSHTLARLLTAGSCLVQANAPPPGYNALVLGAKFSATSCWLVVGANKPLDSWQICNCNCGPSKNEHNTVCASQASCQDRSGATCCLANWLDFRRYFLPLPSLPTCSSLLGDTFDTCSQRREPLLSIIIRLGAKL